jgi:sugar-specific transcriptional regulator TrmB
VRKLGKPIKFVALKPEEVIERVKRNLHVEAKEKSTRLETLKGEDVLQELSSLYSQGVKFVEPADLSGSLRGRNNLYNHLDMLIRDSEKTITMVTTGAGINRKMESLMPSLEKAKKRGVKIRIVAPVTKENEKILKEMSKVAEIKIANMKARFTVVDSEELFFMVLDDEKVHPNYDVGIWINTPFFAQALDQLFELAWQKMKPFK